MASYTIWYIKHAIFALFISTGCNLVSPGRRKSLPCVRKLCTRAGNVNRFSPNHLILNETFFLVYTVTKAWRPLEHGQEQETLPKWITPFRRTIRVRRGKSVRFTDSPDSTTTVCGLPADSPGDVLGFNREWCGMPRNVRIVARQCGHIQDHTRRAKIMD